DRIFLPGRAFVPGGGVEPPSKAPKARVLPLDDPGPAPDYAASAGGPTTGSAPSNPAASSLACASSRARPITEEPLPLITAPSAPDSISPRAASPISGCRAMTDRSRSLNRRGPSASASPAVAAASRRSGSGPVPAPSSAHHPYASRDPTPHPNPTATHSS